MLSGRRAPIIRKIISLTKWQEQNRSLAAAAKFGFIALVGQGVAAMAAEVKHLTTPEAAAVIKAKGMEPLGWDDSGGRPS